MAGSAADRAYAHVRSAVMGGEIAPGTMLSENELAARLEMSRTPVRAALLRLQDEGWVTIYAQRGALVRELGADEVRESAEVRHALEAAGVRLATQSVRAALAERLRENLAEQEEALRAGSMQGFARLALPFHRTFVEMGCNETMLGLYDRLQSRQYLSIVQSADRIGGDPQAVLAEHAALVDAAAAGDWRAFGDLLADHQERNHATGTRPAPGR